MSLALSTAQRLESILEKMNEACVRTSRAADSVRLVAVSKTQSPEAVQEVCDAGHLLFGESRIQEAKAKIPLLSSRIEWHFIGHLQKNKIRAALPMFDLFHGVDSFETAEEMNRIADEAGLTPKVLLEVNVAEESTKFGFGVEKLRAQMEHLLGMDRLVIHGLMCIPPPQPKAEGSRPYFVLLRELRDKLENEFHCRLPELSMGMSGDFVIAIEEGATYVRVGSAIFGERKGKSWKPQPEAGFED